MPRTSGPSPRTRGTPQVPAGGAGDHDGPPPHTRGTRPLRCLRADRLGTTPAYAGNARSAIGAAPTTRDHPRVRGERDGFASEGGEHLGPPPRTRGTHGVASATATISRDHPRVRGERDVAHTSLGAVRGTTPAYAGNAPLVTLKASGRWDHPRVRGERNSPKAIPPEGMGPPPRTRGTRLSMPSFAGRYGTTPRTRGTRHPDPSRPARSGTTPAYAGNATRIRSSSAIGRDHPRVRGERYSYISAARRRWGPPPRTREPFRLDPGPTTVRGPPPRTRGTQPQHRRRGPTQGTTPAYAGNARHR